MNEIEQIIEQTNKLCGMLDAVSEMDKKFCQDICLSLEQYSYEVYKIKNQLTELKYYSGY